MKDYIPLKDILHKYLSDIRFWILLFACIRLIGITNPPLETAHNWRQTTVTMVARNFQETDNSIVYPRVDFAGDKTGITGMEFPVLNYGIYLVSEVFGYQHWYGRLINLIISSIGLYFFYLLVRKYFNAEHAFYSTLILLFSIWFIFSRKIMPDTFSMSFMLTGMYYGSNYLDRKTHFFQLVLYGLLISIGMLSKLPAGFILVVFAPLLFSRSVLPVRKLLFILISLIAILPVCWWYFIWVPFLVEEYGFWHFFMGKPIDQGIQEVLLHLPQVLSRFYETAITISGFILFLAGLLFAIKKKQRILLLILLLSFLSFTIVIFKAGFTFAHHSYYVLPFAPIMALVAGYTFTRIQQTWIRTTLVCLVAIECLTANYQDFRISPRLSYLLMLEEDLDKISSKNDLILINSENVPTPMYFAHRKGWIKSNEFISNEKNLEPLIQKGLKYVLILKKEYGASPELSLPVEITNENYTIYVVNTN